MNSKQSLIPDPYLALHLPLHELDGNSFMSKDAYGHLCTASGGLWTPQGRSFDGVDDRIEVPASPGIISQAQGTLSIRFNTSAASVLFSMSDKDTNQLNELFIQTSTSGNTISISLRAGGIIKYLLRTPAGAYAHNKPFHLVYTSNGSAVRCWLNGIEQELTAAGGTNDGSWFGAMSDIDNCYIGVLLRNLAFVVPAKGIISEVINYGRPLAPAEIESLLAIPRALL